MPPVAAAVTAAVAELTISTIIANAIINTAVGLVLSGIQRALTSKPKTPILKPSKSGTTTQVKQPTATRTLVYGEQRVSGPVLDLGMTNSNKYLHMVIALAGHEITEIGEVWLNDYPIASDHLDADGTVNTGRYDGLVRIRKHLGSPDQAADTLLITELPDRDSNHRFRGIAYIYVRLKWDQDKFPTGIPNISAWVRGKNILDVRDSTNKFSMNTALCMADYLVDTEYGLGDKLTISDIDTDFVDSAANTSDEFVTTTDISKTISSIDTATEIIELNADLLEFQRGDRVQVTTTDTLPSGISAATNYYVIPYQRKDNVRIKLAASLDDAMDNVAIDITDTGTGTHTITKNAEPVGASTVKASGKSVFGAGSTDVSSPLFQS